MCRERVTSDDEGRRSERLASETQEGKERTRSARASERTEQRSLSVSLCLVDARTRVARPRLPACLPACFPASPPPEFIGGKCCARESADRVCGREKKREGKGKALAAPAAAAAAAAAAAFRAMDGEGRASEEAGSSKRDEREKRERDASQGKKEDKCLAASLS